MQKHPRRPIHLKVLILLEGVNSAFLLLWGALLPVFPWHEILLLASGKLLVRFLVATGLSIAGFVVACGLWMQLSSAFRMGFTLAVFTLAFAIFWMILSLSSASFDLGSSFVLILNVMIIFLFLQPPVARAMVSREKR